MDRSQVVCFVLFARPGHKAPNPACAGAAMRCRVAPLHQLIRIQVEKRNCSLQHRPSCLSMAICCSMHACSSMASASFAQVQVQPCGRTGGTRCQETSNGHQLAFHARTRPGSLSGAWSSQRTLPWPLLSLPRQLQAPGYRSTAGPGHHFVFD
jgi:hypothetical protein